MAALTAAEISQSARAFLAAAAVAPEVLALRPDYRVLVVAAEGLEPGPPDQASEGLLARAETRDRTALDGRAPEDVPPGRRPARRLPGVRRQAPAHRPSVEALPRRLDAGLPRIDVSPTPTTRSRSRTWRQSPSRTWTSTRARPGWSAPPGTRTSAPWRTASQPDELICRADEPAGVLETARCSRRGRYAVAVMPARSMLACHSRAAAVVS